MRRSPRSGMFSSLVLTASVLIAPFEVQATPLFSVTQSFQKPTPAADDYFGNALAAVGSNVLVGAAADSTWATNAGAAYLFNPSGGLIRSFKASNPTDYDAFGYSVAAFGSDVL